MSKIGSKITLFNPLCFTKILVTLIPTLMSINYSLSTISMKVKIPFQALSRKKAMPLKGTETNKEIKGMILIKIQLKKWKTNSSVRKKTSNKGNNLN